MKETITYQNSCPFCGMKGMALSERCSTHCENCCNCRKCNKCETVSSANPSEDFCSLCDYALCKECCTRHVQCIECETMHSKQDFCATCMSEESRRCIDCCTQHVTCRNCRVRVRHEDYCRSCSSCINCRNADHNRMCNHERALNVQQANYVGNSGEPVFFKGEYTEEFPTERFAAIELEYYALSKPEIGFKINQTMRKWRGAVVHDGSILDATGQRAAAGFEINSAPASGTKFIEQVREITSVLKETGATINKSCGFHAHIDAREFSYMDLRKLILLYKKLEPAIFKIVAPSRRNNTRYAAACAEKFSDGLEDAKLTEVRKQILQNVYGNGNTKLRDVAAEKWHPARYTAMCMHSWARYGTIEARIHQGTSDFDKIVNWTALWAGIVDFAAENSAREIMSLRGSNTKLSIEALTLVAPSDKVRDWIAERIETLSKNVDENQDV